jgi:hypothetical protein
MPQIVEQRAPKSQPERSLLRSVTNNLDFLVRGEGIMLLYLFNVCLLIFRLIQYKLSILIN